MGAELKSLHVRHLALVVKTRERWYADLTATVEQVVHQEAQALRVVDLLAILDEVAPERADVLHGIYFEYLATVVDDVYVAENHATHMKAKRCPVDTRGRTMRRVCSWCGQCKDGCGIVGKHETVTHGICKTCAEKQAKLK